MAEVSKDTTKVDWSDEKRRHFINAMVHEAAKGAFVDNGFKKQSWQAIQDEFNSNSGCRYDKSQLHSHYAVLKKKYNIYKALKDNSGFGVDPINGGPTAPGEVWSAYINAHPEAAQFRGKPYVFFEDLDSIFTGKVASGKYAKSSNFTPSPGEFQKLKKARIDSVDASWLSVQDKPNDENDRDDDDGEDSDEGNHEKKIPAQGDARIEPKKQDGLKQIQPVPVRLPRPKPLNDITNILGKIVSNQDKIVAHHMTDSKLDQALKLFSSTYSKVMSVSERLRFKINLSKQADAPAMFLQLDEEERVAYIEEIINTV